MSLGKKDIINNISSETFLHKSICKNLLESFLDIIIKNKSKKIKISNFGSFYTHESPERTGRNPKTMLQYKIPTRKKVTFKPSALVKDNLN